MSAWSSTTKALPKHTFINCWNLSEVESAALWSIYTPRRGGVAITSSFERLCSAFSGAISPVEATPLPIHVGRVRYIDYATEGWDTHQPLVPFFHKRRSFESENEIRAVIMYVLQEGQSVDSVSPRGLQVGADFDALIERLHVSPDAPLWFADLVRGVCRRYGFDPARVCQSSLDADPIW